jgi:hypothetical protein
MNTESEVDKVRKAYEAAREEYKNLSTRLRCTPRNSSAYRQIAGALKALTVKGKALAAKLELPGKLPTEPTQTALDLR